MPNNTLLLVMDMVNDLVHPEGPNGEKGYGPEVKSRDIVTKTAQAIVKARAAGVRVGFVRIGFSPDYRECPPDSPIFSKAREAGLFKLGTWGTDVHPDLGPRESDFDIVKHRVSPFYGTALEPILRANAIGRLVMCGVSTNAVVQSGVREAHDRDYDCVLLEDCCAALTDEEHQLAIKSLNRFCTVTTEAEFSF